MVKYYQEIHDLVVQEIQSYFSSVAYVHVVAKKCSTSPQVSIYACWVNIFLYTLWRVLACLGVVYHIFDEGRRRIILITYLLIV